MTRQSRTFRRGAALIYALVILAVLSALMAIATQNVVSGRRVLMNRADQLQAQWLARAGIERAVAKLKADANYGGETFELAPQSKIVIKVTKDDGRSQITSEAEFSGIGLTASKATSQREISNSR